MSEIDFKRLQVRAAARRQRIAELQTQAATWRQIAFIGWGALAIIVGCLLLVKVGWL